MNPAASIRESGALPLDENVPLAVDLDGTLVLTDMLHENVVLLLKHRPWLLLLLPFWLLRGKAFLKREVATRVRLNYELIPLNEPFYEFLREQKRLRRRLGLFSASDEAIVKGMAARLKIFDVAIGSNGRENLAGHRKVVAIEEVFGGTFAYAGNSRKDLEVWSSAKAAIVVGKVDALRPRVTQLATIEREFPTAPMTWKTWAKMLRIHQWVKNLLIFVPFVLAVPAASLHTVMLFVGGFLSLSLLASSTYIANDLVDLEADRRHRSKRFRPLASGSMSIVTGVLVSGALALAGFGITLLLLPAFLWIALAYVVITLAYSFAIKRIALLDAICLGCLFTLRIYSGTIFQEGAVPYWLLAFSMFFFISLALAKRYTELLANAHAGTECLPSRGYRMVDKTLVLVVGIATAMCAIVVFLIYLGDQHFDGNLFTAPHWLGLSCIAIGYWLLRVWLLAVRDEMHDDPIMFALKDRASLALGAVVLLSLGLAW